MCLKVKRKRDNEMNDNEENRTMPSFRIGKMVRYGNGEERFVPAHNINGQNFYQQFANQYFTDRDKATIALRSLKKALYNAAAEASKYMLETDREMAERMARRECTQEDCRKPYYNQMSDAYRAVDHYRMSEWFLVGAWSEPPSVTRLNTLLSDSPDKVRELDEKMAWYGECEIGWACHGHTRAEWQSEADAAWIAVNRPAWKVVNRGMSLMVRS